jgi:hypothetical protein
MESSQHLAIQRRRCIFDSLLDGTSSIPGAIEREESHARFTVCNAASSDSSLLWSKLA